MSYLDGRLLIAMPTMGDPRFDRTVIYLCAHSKTGAMGLIINKPAEHMTLGELLIQLDIDPGHCDRNQIVLTGGPVETSRGFVLHSSDYYVDDTTLRVTDETGLTATLDILKAIARGQGPKRQILALGYAGWGAGQLESEIQANGWLHCDADDALLFDTDLETKWARAMAKLGVNPALLSMSAGHA